MKTKFVLAFVLSFTINTFSQVSLDSCIVWEKPGIGSAHKMDISPDNKYMALPWYGSIRIYSLDKGSLFKEINANNGELNSVKYSSDGRYLISGGDEGLFNSLITIWNTSTWDTIKTLYITEPYQPVRYATMSHDNRYIAGTIAERGVNLWNFETLSIFKNYPPLPYSIGDVREMPNYIEFSSDDRFFAVTARFNPGRLIDVQKGTDVIIDDCSNYPYETYSYYATISRDITKFVSSCISGAHIFDIQSKKLLRTISSGQVTTISISNNSKYIVMGNGKDPLIIWDINNGDTVAISKIRFNDAKFTSDSKFLIVLTFNGLCKIDLSKITGFNSIEGDYFKSNKIINISPNPASDFIEINVDSPSIKRGSGGVWEIGVFDVFGQKVTTPSLRATPPYQGGEKVRIDVSALAPGIYFVRIGAEVRKFVKI